MKAERSGPEAIFEIADPRAHLMGFIVVDSTRLGPAFGGVRIRQYSQERDALLEALDLAAAMSLKAALAGLDCGGGKIVIIDKPRLRRAQAISAIARALNDLGGRFFAGRDYGMTPSDLVRLGHESRFVAIEGPAGMGDLSDATARGTIAAVRAAIAHSERPGRFDGSAAGATNVGPGAVATPRTRHRAAAADLDGLRVAVQGLGAVGGAIVRRLLEAGARVVAADIDSAAARRAAALGARIVAPGRLSGAAVDVFIPAAGGGTLDLRFAERCRARVVCGPENCALAAAGVEPALLRRGIIYVPDMLAGAGGLITGVLHQMREGRGVGAAVERIGARTTRLLRESDRSGLLPSEVASRAALHRLVRGR